MRSPIHDAMRGLFLAQGPQALQIKGKTPESPSPQTIRALMNHLYSLLFPVLSPKLATFKKAIQYAEAVAKMLRKEIEKAVGFHATFIGETLPKSKVLRRKAEDWTEALFTELPQLRALLETDAKAAYAGDPAAKSMAEIYLSYPGFLAIAFHRTAHFLANCGVPLLPRMISEIIHSQTGIDIHPGAKIGESFFIDHGTGVVIGETTEIGPRVKLYQGVTLGALSTLDRDSGSREKRHPTIESDVTIYAEATILGGNTTIGRGSVIGGNVWLTRSVPPLTRVMHKGQDLVYQSLTE